MRTTTKVIPMRLKIISSMAMFLLVFTLVQASDYTPTGRQDFQVWIDPQPTLEGYVYSSVEIPVTNGQIVVILGETNVSMTYNVTDLDWKCINILFAYDNSSGTPRYIHVQSNPPHDPPNLIGSGETGQRPEDLGYFQIHAGLGNMYFRNSGLVAYNQYLFVAKCANGNASLIYEEDISPLYKEFTGGAAARGVWFTQNASYIVLFLAVIFLVFLFIYFRFGGGR